jgi:DNA sulfur modification protein DndC
LELELLADYILKKQVVCANGFISLTGSRKDEGTARKKRLDQSTQEGSFLKINQTYRFSNNMAPIEEWNTKDVWNYLFEYSLDWLDDLALWDLYADASGKGEECAFVGAGDKEVVDDGKVGCAKK